MFRYMPALEDLESKTVAIAMMPCSSPELLWKGLRESCKELHESGHIDVTCIDEDAAHIFYYLLKDRKRMGAKNLLFIHVEQVLSDE